MKLRPFHQQVIADMLRERRRFLAMSQESLAVASGVGVKSISTFETNSPRRMSIDQFLRLLSGLGWTPREFFEEYERKGQHGEG